MRRLLAWLCLALCACRALKPQGEESVRAVIQFSGALSFPEKELQDAIELDLEDLARRTSRKSVIDDAAYTLLEFYRSRGFVDASVDYELLESVPKRVHAVFRILEGPRCELDSVEIAGRAQVDKDELLDAIGLEDRGSAREPRWFVQAEVDRAADLLESHYRSRGFLEARVSEPEVIFDADHRHASVLLRVHEGVRSRVATPPEIHGGLPAIDREVDLASYVGRPLSPSLPSEIRGKIEEAYQSRGYPDVLIEVRLFEPQPDGRAELHFELEPGPQVQISRVEVEGNKKTDLEHVLALIELEPGDLYDVTKVRDSFRALYRTGLFRRVRVELAPGSEPQRPLQVIVEEVPSTEIFVEPGFGSYEGFRLLIGARETNLLGRGRSIHGDALLAQRAQRLVGGVSDPRLLGTSIEGNLSLFREVRDEPSFDKDERGLAVTLSRELRPRFRVSTEYRFRISEISNVDFNDPLAIAALQDVDISSVAAIGSYDNRDSVFVPTRGHTVKLSVEFADSAIGSELDFTRVKLSHASFFELDPGRVIGLSWRAGVITPIEDTDTIPVQERFFNGGENTVRSFKEHELGPKDSSGEPLGGEAFNVLSAELRQRIHGNFEAAAFYDTGNVESDAHRFFQFRGFRHGLGLGMRYLLPIGPLRLDAGWNPDPRSDEDDWTVHFSVGASF